MNNYKRLTERFKNGFVHYKCSKKDMKDCGLYYNCGECHKSTEALDRLAELEDKIEQGTLVDTEAYFIVEENQWAGKNSFLVCQNAIQLAICDFCETREEAEKRLKELQE